MALPPHKEVPPLRLKEEIVAMIAPLLQQVLHAQGNQDEELLPAFPEEYNDNENEALAHFWGRKKGYDASKDAPNGKHQRYHEHILLRQWFENGVPQSILNSDEIGYAVAILQSSSTTVATLTSQSQQMSVSDAPTPTCESSPIPSPQSGDLQPAHQYTHSLSMPALPPPFTQTQNVQSRECALDDDASTESRTKARV